MDRIRVDQVVTDRDIDAAEDLPNEPEILRIPIIVSRKDNVLIDGLRRLKAHRDSGAKTVPVILVTGFDEACDALEAQHVGRTLTPRQLWNATRVVYPWGLQESASKRSQQGQITRRSGRPHAERQHGNKTPLRMRMVKVLNCSSGHIFERALYLYRAAENGNRVAQEMALEVDAGKRGIYNATDVVTEAKEFKGNIREQNEQRALLENGSRNLGAQVGALLKLGSPVLIGTEDLETYIQALVTSRSKLATFINQLRAVIRERNHG